MLGALDPPLRTKHSSSVSKQRQPALPKPYLAHGGKVAGGVKLDWQRAAVLQDVALADGDLLQGGQNWELPVEMATRARGQAAQGRAGAIGPAMH